MTTGKVDMEVDTKLDTKADDDNWHNRYKTILFYRGSSYTRQSSPPTSIADPHQMECSDIFQFQFQFDGEVIQFQVRFQFQFRESNDANSLCQNG